MKQKKILGTIASLCLAIALLAFGVYSAGAVTFNVTNTVTYTFTDVLVDINAKLYKVTSGTSAIVTAGGLDTMDTGDWTEVAGGVTNGTLKSYTGSDGVYTQDPESSTGNSNITFDMNTAFAYMVTIDFTTVSNAGITITYNSSAFVDADGDNVKLVVKDNASNNAIVAGQTYTFVYYVLLEDATKEANVTLPALNFTVNKTGA